MSFFNAIYTLGGCRTAQPIQEDSKITLEPDSQETLDYAVRWAKWIVTSPIRFAHGLYNQVSLTTTKDINEVVSRQIYSGNSINYLPLLFGGKSGHIISCPRVILAMRSHFRHDPNGPFERETEDPFLPMLKDLYPDTMIDQEDFLFTCSHGNVATYRNPLLEYIGPKALQYLRPQITQIAEEVLDSFANRKEAISARDLAGTYTVAILARLFLNHPGSLEEYQNIGGAASSIFEYQFLKKWGSPDAMQVEQYTRDLETLRSAIDLSSGEFIDSLEASNFSSIRIKGELLLTYATGSETTTSALQYILWRLGQDLDLQDKIRKNPESYLDHFISECLAQYTPVPIFSRVANRDLVLNVHNRNETPWQYPIAKGELLMIAPLLAEGFTFGVGVHTCPGQWLAKAEIRSMILALVNHYVIDSSPRKKELATLPGYGFPKVESVDLTLQKTEEIL